MHQLQSKWILLVLKIAEFRYVRWSSSHKFCFELVRHLSHSCNSGILTKTVSINFIGFIVTFYILKSVFPFIFSGQPPSFLRKFHRKPIFRCRSIVCYVAVLDTHLFWCVFDVTFLNHILKKKLMSSFCHKKGVFIVKSLPIDRSLNTCIYGILVTSVIPGRV